MAVTVHHGDMREVLPTLEARFHAVVTDPPYHLTTGKKGGSGPDSLNLDSPAGRARISTGFMGKAWDGGSIAFQPETWAGVGAVMRPGAHLVAFGGTKGFHRMACAIEDAGFEIRDTLAWLYGSGFPKSLNQAGEWQGYGTALKPAFEPIILARWPMVGTVAANLEAHGCGALNIEACRIEGASTVRVKKGGRGQFPHEDDAWEPKTVTVGSDAGRWPANVVHDGSEEVLAAFPDSGNNARENKGSGIGFGSTATGERGAAGHADSGSAARFFYSAKAGSADRLESKHPTVKPVDLMRWLVRLVTPRGGLVLDPFAGSGTTAMACMAEGFGCHLVEREADYVADIRRRVAHVSGMDTPLFAV